jgi:ribosomal protein L32
MKTEAGLRVCPRCGKPVHLSSIVCRECGAHVPKR